MNRRAVLAAAAVLSLAAVAAAVYTQQAWDMQPCPWCVLQRLIFLGIAAALWQHFVAASAESCDLTLADRIMAATGLDGAYPEVFMAMASCADAKVNLFGLPYEAWSGGLFLLIAAAMAWVIRARR